MVQRRAARFIKHDYIVMTVVYHKCLNILTYHPWKTCYQMPNGSHMTRELEGQQKFLNLLIGTQKVSVDILYDLVLLR